MRDEEKRNTGSFNKVPEHYVEVALAFLLQSTRFSGDQREKARTLILLRELIEVRRGKITEGLKDFDPNPLETNVTNMSAAELSCFRTRSLHALDNFLQLIESARKLAPAVAVRPSQAEEDDSLQQDSSSR